MVLSAFASSSVGAGARYLVKWSIMKKERSEPKLDAAFDTPMDMLIRVLEVNRLVTKVISRLLENEDDRNRKTGEKAQV